MEEVQERRRLGVISFGVALGFTLALFTFVIGVGATLFGWGILVVQVLSTVYIGYSPSIMGWISGAVWGFVNGFVFGAILAWIYNRILRGRRPR
jgi:hypothetical protein